MKDGITRCRLCRRCDVEVRYGYCDQCREAIRHRPAKTVHCAYELSDEGCDDREARIVALCALADAGLPLFPRRT